MKGNTMLTSQVQRGKVWKRQRNPIKKIKKNNKIDRRQ
jgi:hypothetical protein